MYSHRALNTHKLYCIGRGSACSGPQMDLRDRATQTNPAVEQNKNVKWLGSPWNRSGRRGQSLWWKGFAKEPSPKFRMKDCTSEREEKWR